MAKRQITRNDDTEEDKYKDNEEKGEGDNNNEEKEQDKANNKKQNMLSRVTDELERFKKIQNYQNLTSEMMESVLDGPPHSKCLENAKDGGGRNMG